jgi:hypothetical protein
MLKTKSSITISLIASIFLILKMYTGSNLYLLLFLFLVLAGMCVVKNYQRIEFLLYFISWVYVMKFDFTQFSLFVVLAIFYLIISLVYLFKNDKPISSSMFLTFIVFSIYSLCIPILSGGNLVEALGFVLNFSVLYFAIIQVKIKQRILRGYIVAYCIGLVVSAGVRFASFSIPNLNSYIEAMTRVNTVKVEGSLNIRFAGLDLDPNYFALQVLIAIACLMVVIYYQKKLNLRLLLLTMILVFFGVMSFSKMFIISFLIFLLVTTFILFKTNIKAAMILIITTIIIGGICLSLYSEFLYGVYWNRFFGSGSSLEAITTGRTDNWAIFLIEIITNFKILVLGAGFGTPFYQGIIAHNMYITFLYYMGISGVIITLLYFRSLYLDLHKRVRNNESILGLGIFSVNSIPIYLMLISNVALDSFVMDYFPFHIFLIIISLVITKNEKVYE